MKSTRQANIRLGMYIAVGVALFILIIYLIGNKQKMFGMNVKVTTVFRDVVGLREGGLVRFTGIDVGAVSKLTIESDSSVLVEMAIDKKVTPFIKKNSIATIGSQGLMGNKLIILLPGSPDEASIEPGDQLPSVPPVEADDILKEVKTSSERISVVSGNLIDITRKMNRGEGIFGKIFTDTAFAANLAATSQNLRTLSDGISRGEGFLGKLLADPEFSADLDSTAQYIAEISANLEGITDKVNRGEGVIGKLFTDTAFTINIYEASENLSASTRNLEEVTWNLIELTETMNEGQGAFNKIMADSAFADSLDIALHNLNETLIEIRKASEALQHSGLVRAFSKKSKRKATEAAAEEAAAEEAKTGEENAEIPQQ
jgi:phospholipid/cholesterol/gamma-HCH transport system substrate-binding protein